MLKRDMMQQLCLAAILGCCCLPATAQTQANDTTVNRTVVVEQEYNPTIRDAAKVNVMPEVPALPTTKKSARFVLNAQPASHIQATPMQAFTGEVKRDKGFPGEVRLAYGNLGQVEAVASYRWLATPKDQLLVNAGLTGRDGKLDRLDETGKWNSHFYRTQAALDWIHRFRQVNLKAGGDFDLSNFNFQPGLQEGKQKFTSGAFHVGVQSHTEDRPVWFQVETGIQLFQRQHDLTSDDIKEALIRTRGEVSAAFNDEQRIAVAIQMENGFFQKADFENYTTFDLNPYFTWNTDDWKLHAGAHVNPSLGFSKKMRVAPDVTVQYIAGESHILYAQATGGRQLNDFRRLQDFSPYSQLATQLEATYEQINAALGVKGSPLAGWWFHVYGGYQNLKDDLIQGAAFTTEHTNNMYGGLETRYSYKDLFSLHLQGIYRHWNADEESALLFKPSVEAQVNLGFRPIHPLQICLGYQHQIREKVAGEKLEDVSNLHAEINYDLLPNVGLYARFSNLLNQEYQEQWGYQAVGFNFLGGVNFRF